MFCGELCFSLFLIRIDKTVSLHMLMTETGFHGSRKPIGEKIGTEMNNP
jgi:hypothetical protein